MRFFLASLLCFACFGPPSFARAQSRTFVIEGGNAQFVSDAPLERITGVSSKVRGSIQVDPAHPESARGEVHVSVASIRTNVELRDEHLRSEAWLNAARFPDATFVLGSVSGAPLASNQANELKVNGKFSVHGVTHDVSTTARVRYVAGSEPTARDTLRVQASFVVHLDSYGVSIPSIVALKVAKDIQVNIDLHASADRPAPAPAAEPVAVTPAPAAPAQPEVAPEKPAKKPADKPRAPRESSATSTPKPRTPSPTQPSARPPEPAHERPSHASEPAASAAPAASPLAAPPSTPGEAAAAVHALLRKAHYELMHGDHTRALRFVQHAQKLMPMVEQGVH
jgi:polyisoprenoid-binding protein YceI